MALSDNSEFDWSSAFAVVPESGYRDQNFTITVRDASELNYEDPNWRSITMTVHNIALRELAPENNCKIMYFEYHRGQF